MGYKAAIFDLDGTLLDTLQDLTNSLNYAMEQNGYPQHTLHEVQYFVGNGVRMLVKRGCPAGTSEENEQKAYDDFVRHYARHSMDNTKPYDGIPELLQALLERGIRISVVSNKLETAVIDLCNDFFPNTFEFMVGNRPDLLPKPAPDSVYEVVDRLGLERSDIVYIGDSEVDLQTAENSGMDCIGVDWGFRDAEYLRNLGATYVVKTPAEILEIVSN